MRVRLKQKERARESIGKRVCVEAKRGRGREREREREKMTRDRDLVEHSSTTPGHKVRKQDFVIGNECVDQPPVRSVIHVYV